MARAFGKVILLGEHAVVFGHPAIGAALGRGVIATASPTTGPSALEISPWNVRVTQGTPAPAPNEQLSRAFDAIAELYAGEAPIHVHAEVALAGGAGLGCSAALGVAVVRAFDEAAGISRHDAETAARSLAWELVFHGNPSGVDSALAASGGTVVFRKGEPLSRVRLGRPVTLVVGDTKAPSATRAMVESVARQRERAPARIEQTFDAIAALVVNARSALEAGDLRELGRLMDLDQALLSSLMLSTAKLEELCAVARAAGALGAKLTGAGGGGCMIALVDDQGVAANVARELEAHGADAFVEELRS